MNYSISVKGEPEEGRKTKENIAGDKVDKLWSRAAGSWELPRIHRQRNSRKKNIAYS